MRYARMIIGFISVIAATGCANLQKSIQNRVAISEECRATLAAPLQNPGQHANIASVSMGYIGHCDLTNDESFLALCSLAQIRTKFGIASDSGTGKFTKEDLKPFDGAVFDLRVAMTNLAWNVRSIDTQYQKVLKSVKSPNIADRIVGMNDASDTADSLKSAVKEVRRAHEATRHAAVELSKRLPQQAAIEFAAWDANLRIQLAQLEQLLSGNFSLAFDAGIRDEVLTHVARRSLELLHGALKPADAVINRLDDKAYGAVSVSYLAFGPDLQDAVDGAFNRVKEVYEKRVPHATANASPAPTSLFLHELKRAACDNLTQGTHFSMLSELVDTMLILKVGRDDQIAKAKMPSLDPNLPPNDAAIFPSPSGNGESRGNLPLTNVRFVLQDTVAAAERTSPPKPPLPPISPLSVYATNQWMARQQLLTQKITTAVTAPRTDGSAKPTPFENIESVDEGMVKQITDAATAKAIDDAARLDPSMLNQSPGDIGPQIRNSVNVVTAATAVSQASAVLKLNISISNVNTFSPTNSINVAPVFTVPPSAGTPSAAVSPCAALDLESIGVSCFDNDGNVTLAFSRQHFQSDSCVPGDLAPSLAAIGSMFKGYRTRSGISYRAAIDGYASLPDARLARCPVPRFRQAHVCNYVNALNQSVPIAGCGGKGTNRNVALSAQRALAAAKAIESAAGGAVVVDGLQASGTAIAGKREAGAPASLDQTVMIRLTPRVNP